MKVIPFLVAVVLIGSALSAPAQTTRTLHFSEDRPIGRLYEISDGPDDLNSYMGPAWWWDNPINDQTEELAPARGTVVIPPGTRLSLQLYNTSPLGSPNRTQTSPLAKEQIAQIAQLAQFAPDGLEALTIQGDGGPGDEALAAIAKLTGLKRLTLINTVLTTQGLERLQALRGLETLVLSQTRLSQPIYEQLAKLKSLKRLSFNYCDDISSASLAALARLPRLEHLILGDRTFPDPRGLDRLARLSNLRILSVHFDGKTGSSNLAALARIPRLERLFISGISPEDLRRIGEFSALKGLRLYSMFPFTEGDLEEIAKIKGLEELFMDGTVESEGLAHLAALPSLRTFRVTGKPLTREGLAELARCPALEVLSVGQLPTGSLPLLARMGHLKQLSLGGNEFRPEDLDKLAGLKNLESLSIARGLDDEALGRLARVQSLRRLTLMVARQDTFSGVTSAGLAHLCELPHLESFECYYSQVFGDGLAQLARIPTLKRLYLMNTPYPQDEDVVQLTRLKHLEDLYLKGSYLTDKTLDALATIPSLRRLEFLSPGPELTPAGVTRLRRARPDLALRGQIAQRAEKAPTPSPSYRKQKDLLIDTLKQESTGEWLRKVKDRRTRKKS